MTEYYHRLIVWKPEHDAAMRKAYLKVFGQLLMNKTPLQNRYDNRLMIGTSMFTAEREAQMKELLKGIGCIVKTEPLLWWSI